MPKSSDILKEKFNVAGKNFTHIIGGGGKGKHMSLKKKGDTSRYYAFTTVFTNRHNLNGDWEDSYTIMLFVNFAALILVIPRVSSEYPLSFMYEHLMDSILDFSMTGFNLLVQNSPQQGNVLYSPFSIYNVLMMAHLGARGKTAQQICNTLGICHFNKTTVRFSFIHF
ncbi:hypothetical protein CEXT_153571 [Caerostris extrusa]|uniref:Serpin domain-containing protein n=1 Tax=Caerostris extrusa TaxID=172846 RepID=A0AAV4RTX7_CAEEX|nr:hypothetical protein CEXT_153571 [Caerostris extrusa]